MDADLDLAHISEEYKRSEREILQTAVDVVINSPIKKSPKRPMASTASPIRSAKIKFNF